jgi:hypothetical protein
MVAPAPEGPVAGTGCRRTEPSSPASSPGSTWWQLVSLTGREARGRRNGRAVDVAGPRRPVPVALNDAAVGVGVGVPTRGRCRRGLRDDDVWVRRAGHRQSQGDGPTAQRPAEEEVQDEDGGEVRLASRDQGREELDAQTEHHDDEEHEERPADECADSSTHPVHSHPRSWSLDQKPTQPPSAEPEPSHARRRCSEPSHARDGADDRVIRVSGSPAIARDQRPR